MKKRFTDEQIIQMLKEQEADVGRTTRQTLPRVLEERDIPNAR